MSKKFESVWKYQQIWEVSKFFKIYEGYHAFF